MLQQPLNTVCFCVRIRSRSNDKIEYDASESTRWFARALPRLIPTLRVLGLATEHKAYAWWKVTQDGVEQATMPIRADQGERVIEYLSDPANGLSPRFEGQLPTPISPCPSS